MTLDELAGSGEAFGADDPWTGGLAEHGYRTREFLLRGDGFATRLLVREPAGDASGVVVLEPMHYSGGRPVWRSCHEYLLRCRHTWAEVACQTTPAHAMVRRSPDRYRAVHLPGRPSALTPFDGAGLGLRERSDRFSQVWWDTSPRLTDILSAAIRAVRDLGCGTVVLAGSSQSGGVVRRYATALGPYDEAPDGFLPLHSGGAALTTLRRPTVEVLAEADLESVRSAAGLPGQGRDLAHRGGDPRHYVVYEVPGMAHVDSRYAPPEAAPPPGSRWSTFPHTHVTHAALDALVAWARDGVAPPRSCHLDVSCRDAAGHPDGGWRTPAVDLPRARLEVISPGEHWSRGHEYPLPAPRGYPAAAESVLTRLVDQRRYLPEDAATWLRETLKG
ncbi:hypothetical protein GCM10027445_52230 [Amycolatopsis endophytica]|uniref:Alpha/beta hydrolase domain-containing protein n=1 Tax=Amycolatopsis endophytica TaxID=860233 RepID=A0A853BAA9_9PSEU|nr:alpha/beta hydrolase domain-containing protein [Amycolatopsis endophytica]NYI91704.1 hypothetical protein [Amycolatopsis endophytica]